MPVLRSAISSAGNRRPLKPIGIFVRRKTHVGARNHRAGGFSNRICRRCRHLEGFLKAVNQELDSMAYRRQFHARIQETRAIAADQYRYLSQMLEEAARRRNPCRRCGLSMRWAFGAGAATAIPFPEIWAPVSEARRTSSL